MRRAVVVGLMALSALLARAEGPAETVSVTTDPELRVDVYQLAREQADSTLRAVVDGRELTIRYAKALGTDVAERFAAELRVSLREREAVVAALRDQVRSRLHPDTYARIADGPALGVGPIETTWYLVELDLDSLHGFYWKFDPSEEVPGFHFLTPGSAPYSDDDLRVRFDLSSQLESRLRHAVGLLLDEPPPVWLVEGLGSWLRAHYEREHGRSSMRRPSPATLDDLDGLARLAWRHPTIRSHVLDWRGQRRYQRAEPWERLALEAGARGFWVSLEAEIGREAVLDLVVDVARTGGEREKGLLRRLERAAGEPLESIGALAPEARARLGERLRNLGSLACTESASELGALTQLGLLPEPGDRTSELLLELTRCDRTEVAEVALQGLIYGGHLDTLTRAVAWIEEHRSPLQIGEYVDTWETAQGMLASKRARKWFR